MERVEVLVKTMIENNSLGEFAILLGEHNIDSVSAFARFMVGAKMDLLGYEYSFDLKNEINQILQKNGLPALEYEGGEDIDY
mgnify:CR=1 FL=1